ncbi:MAG: penicillin-binding protein 2 [Arenicellales bacterium]|nr:penicillin-binding protein 2 [Arenicellales bacterium]
MAKIRIKDYLRETTLIQSRLVVASIIVVLLLSSLLVRLYYLQVEQHSHYATLSRENRLSFVAIPPARGHIYDRNGIVVAENLPTYTLEVIPDNVTDMEEAVDRVARLIELTDVDMIRFQEALKARPGFEIRTLKSGLTDEEVARFAVNQHLFNGFQINARLQRHYPHGEEMVHVVGYVGRISEDDLSQIDKNAYRGMDYIGKLGIEAYYERTLMGQAGYEQVETNAHGRVVRTLNRVSPVAGKDLHLNVDLNLQQAAREYLGEFQGSVIAVEPKTGAVLAFVSNPAYNPNPFVNGIDTESYKLLREDVGRPLLNRALHGRYAPGSTVKPIMALAGLEHQRSPGHKVFGRGWFSLPGSRHRYRCWKKEGHGWMNMHDAIVQSCDVYFYTLANGLGISRLHEFLTRFGLGKQTGIDLVGEPSGLVPSEGWKREARGEPWWPGETVIAGIGQGYTLVTPLQLAMVTATIANRGERNKPQIVQAVSDSGSDTKQFLGKQNLEQVSIRNQGFYKLIDKAMVDVMHGKRGTARRSGLGAEYQIAGKTGTAQVIGIKQGATYNEKNIAKRFRDHALFVAYAPVDDPKIAVAVIAENGGGGSRTAAPIARKVMDYYLIGPPPPEEEVEDTKKDAA